ncbi:MAG: hypothetical protein ACK5H1_10185 [Tenacibaculum sp.]
MYIDIKFHLVFFLILGIIFTLILFLSYFKTKKTVILFLGYFCLSYCIFLTTTIIYDIKNQYLLYSYDLNKNGIFELDEQNLTQQNLIYKNDLGINFVPFFSIFISIPFAFILMAIHFCIKNIKANKWLRYGK